MLKAFHAGTIAALTIAACSSGGSDGIGDDGDELEGMGGINGYFEKNVFPSNINETGIGDLFSITNSNELQIVALNLNLTVGEDNDGNGVGLFFDTTEPSEGAPPGSGIANPGFSGSSGYRETESQIIVGTVGTPGYVFPDNAPQPMTGDGAVGINFIFNDFDSNEEFTFGIDVDGFNDAGISDTDTGQIVAEGIAIFSDNSEATVVIEMSIN